MELNRETCKHAAELREEILALQQNAEPVDLMTIKLDLHRFQFAGSKVNFSGMIEFSQALLVAIVGRMNSGKASLMRLISGSLLPQVRSGTEGSWSVFVPAHLRVVNVDQTPLFFNGTLYENLAFGIEVGRADASLDRIRGVCGLLGVDARVLRYLEKDDELKWSDIFSGAQCKLLTIARALINNAELICFHKPLVTLDDEKMLHVIKSLKDHVQQKGLLEKTHPMMRRRRTVVITSSQQFAVEKASEIIRLSSDKGCEKLQKFRREDLSMKDLKSMTSDNLDAV
jgi:ABC-type transport system involved in cytochrome bd biosynthesis fused ATPase/permease subunit